MSKPGRPTFKIYPERLRALRQEAHLKQQSLADAVYVRLGKGSDSQSRLTSYQRIEKTGNTSREFAAQVAEVLAIPLGKDPKTILGLLTGATPEAPNDRKEEIETQLRKQLTAGGNVPLRQALEHLSDTENPVRELAMQIAIQLEGAHLTERQDELAHLAELTGWSMEELLRPTSSHGYWLLSAHAAGFRQTEIIYGISGVLYEIQKEGEDWLNRLNESDARVTFIEEAPWVRVLLEHPRIPAFTRSFSFVRCTPTDSGLLWVKPTWLDHHWIRGLQGWAFTHANFVNGFKLEDRRPQDLRKLRLVFAQITVPEQFETVNFEEHPWLQTVFTHKGDLDELPQEILDKFAREGSSHDLITNWLCAGLWEALEPRLSEMPVDWWRIRRVSGRINFELHMNVRIALQRGLKLHDGLRYVVYLAEELASGELRPAPWRDKSVLLATERLQKQLQLCQDQVAIGPPAPEQIVKATS